MFIRRISLVSLCVVEFVCKCVYEEDIMANMVEIAALAGGAYGALQGIGQFLMMFLPKNTIAFKVSKYIVAGPQREVPPNVR